MKFASQKAETPGPGCQTDFSSGSYFLLQMRNPAIETAQKLYENVQLRPSIEVRRQRLGMDKKRFFFFFF